VLRLPPAFPPHFVAFVGGTTGLPLYSSLLFSSREWDLNRPGCCGSPLVTINQILAVEQFGSPRSWRVLLCLCPAHETPATPLLPAISAKGVAPLAQNTKAAAIAISGLIHMASALAVYASSFGFPYTGKTRFRWVASPFRVGFEPTGLYWRISKRLLHRLSNAPGFGLAPLHFASALCPCALPYLLPSPHPSLEPSDPPRESPSPQSITIPRRTREDVRGMQHNGVAESLGTRHPVQQQAHHRSVVKGPHKTRGRWDAHPKARATISPRELQGSPRRKPSAMRTMRTRSWPRESRCKTAAGRRPGLPGRGSLPGRRRHESPHSLSHLGGYPSQSPIQHAPKDLGPRLTIHRRPTAEMAATAMTAAVRRSVRSSWRSPRECPRRS